MDRVTRDKTSIINDNQHPQLIGLQRPSISERKLTQSRCKRNSEIENFSQLKADDLALLTILFQVLEKNITEYDNILRDVRHIGEYIAKFNKKTFIFKESNNQQNQLMNALSIFEEYLKAKNFQFVFLDKILHHLTDQGELLSPLGEFLLNETQKVSRDQSDSHRIFQFLEGKLTKLENLLKKSSSNIEQNQRHLLIIDQLKEKFSKKNSFS